MKRLLSKVNKIILLIERKRSMITTLQNESIREKIYQNKLRYWQVAEEIGISPSTFTVWLRTELKEDKKKRVISAIDKLSNK